MNKVEDVLFYEVKTFSENEGSLSVLEVLNDIPFEVKRIFYVYNTPIPVVRGKHAHKNTKQLFICVNGSCEIICDDGNDKKTFLLDKSNKALYVPEGIWADEKYLEENTILLVLCNTKYDSSDYIRNYKDFLKWKTF